MECRESNRTDDDRVVVVVMEEATNLSFLPFAVD